MFYKHKVVSNMALNDKFNLIKFRCESAAFGFKIGQFSTVVVKGDIFRCYSFASLPKELPYWEIFVDVTPGGPGTTYLKSLKPGQVIETLPSRGELMVDDKLKALVFGATGCGIAPFLSMLKGLVAKRNKQIYLFWGLRDEKDIALLDLLEYFTKKNKNFHFGIILSKPKANWKGKRGHIITNIMETAKGLPAKGMGIYLSGSGKFIEEAKSLLMKQHLPEEKIYTEACY